MLTVQQILMMKAAALQGANLLKTLAKSVNMGPGTASASLVRAGQSPTAMDTYQPFMQAMTQGLPGGVSGNWRHLVGMARDVANRPGGAAQNPEFAQNFAKMWSVRRQSLKNQAMNAGAQSGLQSIAPQVTPLRRPAAPMPQQTTIHQTMNPPVPVNRLPAMQPQANTF